jgi:hypothetical protein
MASIRRSRARWLELTIAQVANIITAMNTKAAL